MRIPVNEFPFDVEIAKIEIEERQQIAKEIDDQKRKDNPSFKGAFHEKKQRFSKNKKRPKIQKGRNKRRK